MELERQLAKDIGSFTHDPYGFVLYAFPWGEGDLKDRQPEDWQKAELISIGQALQAGDERKEAIQRAIASGHGVGKSAFISWIILWAMATCPDTKGIVTANTEAQLKTKTWAELAKWHKLCICGHWFHRTATAFFSAHKAHEETWRVDRITWNEEKSEGFAGLHNEGKRILVIYDEASAIPDIIWETTEGALTDENTEIIWVTCGNPTRNTGAFRECFGRFRHRWGNRQVDSREVSITNKKQIAQWVDDYGEDSDFVRVRVRGVFPRAGACQLIASDLVRRAMGRTMPASFFQDSPKIMGVDVARFGEDQSAIALRQGLYLAPVKKYRGLDLMTYAGLVSQEMGRENPDAVFIDMTGLGAGVVDRLHQLGHREVIGVDFGGRSSNPDLYLNKRTEMWCKLADWLKSPVAIPDDPELEQDLISPEYGFTGDRGQLVLEKKSDMKKRGLASPDLGDAVALTFAYPVVPRGLRGEAQRRQEDYDPASYGMEDIFCR